jgi:hypothetical protein
MGQGLSVFYTAGMAKTDPEGADHWREIFAAANSVLAKNEKPTWDEPEYAQPMQLRPHLASFPYEWTWLLRRAASYAVQDPPEAPVPTFDDPRQDAVLTDELTMFRSHLVSLAEPCGCYVPIALSLPLWLPEKSIVPGGFLGSSVALVNELVAIAPLIGITLRDRMLDDATAAKIMSDEEAIPHACDRKAWLSFFELGRASVKHGTALVMD